MAACSTDELFSSENRFAKSLRRDSITLVRLSVKEPIDSETADCITAPTEGSKTSSFRLERALASSESLMLKNSGIAFGVSRPEGRSLTDNSYLYDTQLTRLASSYSSLSVMAFPIYSKHSNDLLVEKEIMTKSKSKLIKGTVTLKRLWNLFLGGLILDESKSSHYPSSTSVRSDATITGSYQAC